MSNEQSIYNQLVVISREDLDSLVNDRAQNIVASQKRTKEEHDGWITLPDGERFATREEAAKMLHVNFTTLWRWNKQGQLHARRVGGRRVLYKYSDVMALLNGGM